MSNPRRPQTPSGYSTETTPPFNSGDDISRSDGGADEGSPGVGDRPYNDYQRTEPIAAANHSASPSVNPKTPGRSFYHRSFHGALGMFTLRYICQYTDGLIQIRSITLRKVFVNRLPN